MNEPRFTRIGIIADDLTSATDGAAPFLAQGFVPVISRNNPGQVHAAVVAIDTNSRALDAEMAARSPSKRLDADKTLLAKKA